MRWRSGAGVVVGFDEGVGLGMVHGDDGGMYPFHCTQIADGSRTIDIGAPVEFSVIPGHLGRWEAAAVARTNAGYRDPEPAPPAPGPG